MALFFRFVNVGVPCKLLQEMLEKFSYVSVCEEVVSVLVHQRAKCFAHVRVLGHSVVGKQLHDGGVCRDSLEPRLGILADPFLWKTSQCWWLRELSSLTITYNVYI